MRELRLSRSAAPLLALLLTIPLATLVLRALADTWRAPAIVPQEFGLRGARYALSTGAGVPEALFNGLVIALLATAAALALGWPAARALAGASPRLRRLLLVALALPLLMPPYAAGAGLAEWFLRLGIADTLGGVALAHLTYTLPYVVLALAGTFTRELDELEEAAATMGAGRLSRLRLVSLPVARPAVAAAALLAFVVSWSQYGTTLAVGGGITTLPVMLVPFIGNDPQIAATLALLFLAPTIAALGLTARMLTATDAR